MAGFILGYERVYLPLGNSMVSDVRFGHLFYAWCLYHVGHLNILSHSHISVMSQNMGGFGRTRTNCYIVKKNFSTTSV